MLHLIDNSILAYFRMGVSGAFLSSYKTLGPIGGNAPIGPNDKINRF